MYKTLCLAALCADTACTDGDAVSMQAIGGRWDRHYTPQFIFNITDPRPKNIIFVVRNNDDYPYSNIRLIAELKDLKTNRRETDTLNYILAKPDGAWLGTGFGRTKEIHFQYKTNYKLPPGSRYSVKITQAMRRDLLPGIEDIGVRLQNTTP